MNGAASNGEISTWASSSNRYFLSQSFTYYLSRGLETTVTSSGLQVIEI